MATLEEVSKLAERAEAVQECRNIMNLYQWWHPSGRHAEYMDVWADRDDDILEMPWGIYYGKQGVVNCYMKDHGDVTDEDYKKWACGVLAIHHNDTEILEVAEDGQTARGVWYSPGHETVPEIGPRWSWSIYAVDFILDKGAWKIWRMRLIPHFQSPYHLVWTKKTQDVSGMFSDGTADDPPTDPTYEFVKFTVSKYMKPDWPTPYKTYSDVGYRYGNYRKGFPNCEPVK